MTLMAHQREGVDFLLARRAGIIAFEQGLGKTLVAIEAFRRLHRAGAVRGMLVLCPNSLKRTWAAELERFAPDLDVELIEGARAERRSTLGRTVATVILVNYEAARNEITSIRGMLARRGTVLVLDESHYIKNFRSLNSIAAQHFAPLSEYRWLLTGTPVTNQATDIYPQICVAAAGEPFGSHASFEARYGGKDLGGRARESLAEKIRPFLLRRTKEECLDLPPKLFEDVTVDLPRWQRKLYEAVRDGVAAEVDSIPPEDFHRYLPTGLVRLLRLSQVASNPGLVFPDERRVPGKFAHLDRTVDELVEAGRKVIVWSYYVDTIRLLEARYRKCGSAALYGGIDPRDRHSIAARYQEDPNLRVLVANPAAAGTGLTLTAADYSVYETVTWRYDQYAQSQDRNHRIGQTVPVTYIRLLAADTIEFAILEALSRKARLAQDLIDGDVDDTFPLKLTRRSFTELLQTGRLPASTEGLGP
ncbi:MAG: DEAD/DEAH box helicase [Acidobacteria bacterium]|nr:DEAD/DEAH box helicase [Acidobacteriota bacterium]